LSIRFFLFISKHGRFGTVVVVLLLLLLLELDLDWNPKLRSRQEKTYPQKNFEFLSGLKILSTFGRGSGSGIQIQAPDLDSPKAWIRIWDSDPGPKDVLRSG
jgi:hypothetical protein